MSKSSITSSYWDSIIIQSTLHWFDQIKQHISCGLNCDNMMAIDKRYDRFILEKKKKKKMSII